MIRIARFFLGEIAQSFNAQTVQGILRKLFVFRFGIPLVMHVGAEGKMKYNSVG